MSTDTNLFNRLPDGVLAMVLAQASEGSTFALQPLRMVSKRFKMAADVVADTIAGVDADGIPIPVTSHDLARYLRTANRNIVDWWLSQYPTMVLPQSILDPPPSIEVCFLLEKHSQERFARFAGESVPPLIIDDHPGLWRRAFAISGIRKFVLSAPVDQGRLMPELHRHVEWLQDSQSIHYDFWGENISDESLFLHRLVKTAVEEDWGNDKVLCLIQTAALAYPQTAAALHDVATLILDRAPDASWLSLLMGVIKIDMDTVLPVIGYIYRQCWWAEDGPPLLQPGRYVEFLARIRAERTTKCLHRVLWTIEPHERPPFIALARQFQPGFEYSEAEGRLQDD